jgi:hypothetical protein
MMQMVFSKKSRSTHSSIVSYPIQSIYNKKDYIKHYQILKDNRFSLYNNIQKGCSNCYK